MCKKSETKKDEIIYFKIQWIFIFELLLPVHILKLIETDFAVFRFMIDNIFLAFVLVKVRFKTLLQLKNFNIKELSVFFFKIL